MICPNHQGHSPNSRFRVNPSLYMEFQDCCLPMCYMALKEAKATDIKELLHQSKDYSST